MKRKALLAIALGTGRVAHADTSVDDSPEIDTTRPLPKHSYLRLEPSYTAPEAGGSSSELQGRGVVVYRGLLIPWIDPEHIDSGLRVDLGLEHDGSSTGLDNLEVNQISGVTAAWGVIGTGLVLVLPTATSEKFGSDSVQIGPAIFAKVHAIPHLELSLLARGFFTVAGSTSATGAFAVKLRPTIAYHLPAHLVVSSDGEIELDWLADSSKVPVNLIVGRGFGSHAVVSAGPELEVAGRDRGDLTILLRLDGVL